MTRRFASLLALLTLLSAPAQAQFGRTPTDGVALPERSITSRDDALALELNPAGLAFVDGFDGDLVFSAADAVPYGTGLFLAYGGLGPLGFGGSAQWIRNSAQGGDLKKFNLGFSAQAFDRLALGFAFNFFDSNVDSAVDQYTSWDAGLQIRLAEVFGISASVRDFNTPRLGDEIVEPRYTMGAALRFVDGRYRFELESLYDAGLDDWFLLARTYLEPLLGFALFAELRSTAVRDFGAATLHAGLSFAFGPAAITTALIADFQGDNKGVNGSSTSLRVVSRRLRTVLEPSGFMAGLTLTGSLPERGRHSFLLPDQRSFLDLLVYIDDLSRDDHVSGLVLRLENLGLGLGQHWELRRALQRLRERGKQVVVYLSSADFGDLYLASVADRVYMAPGTPMFPAGLSTTLTYLGDLFDNVGIEPEFVRIAEYKSAPESLMEAEPSAPTLEAANAYLDDSFNLMVGRIADGRGLTVAAVEELVDSSPISAADARSRGVIDEVCFFDELEQLLSAHNGRRTRIAHGYSPRGWRDNRWTAYPRIAVVYVDGNITTGSSGQFPIVGQTSGHQTLIRTLEAVQRGNYEAVVLRVDSPGGSAFASEAIWRAVKRVDENIPVVVSMGNVAASGGYYVAAGGREIFATEMTLTGSIGIFSGHFVARELFEWAGIHRFPLVRGANATLFGLDDPWTDEQREAATRDIGLMYDTFLTRVADNRGRTTEEIDPIARGRVWSGIRAEEVGLVDEIGGLLDAVARARELVGIDPGERIDLVELPARPGLFGLFSLLGVRGEVAISESEAEGVTAVLQSLGLDRVLRLPLLYGDGRPAARLELEIDGLE